MANQKAVKRHIDLEWEWNVLMHAHKNATGGQTVEWQMRKAIESHVDQLRAMYPEAVKDAIAKLKAA